MNNGWPTNISDLLQELEAVGVFHRIGSLREDAVLVEVRLTTTFWEIEFLSEGRVLYEAFSATGAVLDARAFIELVVQWSDSSLPQASLDRQLNELAVMRLLREAGIYFSADEMLMRKVLVEGAVMIEAAVPGERWEIDILESGDIEVERFRSDGALRDFDAEALRRLLASAENPHPAPNRRKGVRG